MTGSRQVTGLNLVDANPSGSAFEIEKRERDLAKVDTTYGA